MGKVVAHLARAAIAALGLALCAAVGIHVSGFWLLNPLLAVALRRALRWPVLDLLFGLLGANAITLAVIAYQPSKRNMV